MSTQTGTIQLLTKSDDTKPKIPSQLNIKLKSTTQYAPGKITNEYKATNFPNGSSCKQTKKAKTHKNAKSEIGSIELPNNIDDIIGDMVFQEPSLNAGDSIYSNSENQVGKNDNLAQQQALVLQKQKELLDQLQQGIRPGWFIQCVGRRADGKQCTRNIKKGSEFCMGHTNKLAYGRITISDPILANTAYIPNITSGVNVSTKSKCASGTNTDDNLESSSESEDEDSPSIPDDIKQLIAEKTSKPIIGNSTVVSGTQTIVKNKVKTSKTKPRVLPASDEPTTTVACIGNGTNANPGDVSKQPKKRGRRRKLPIDSRFGNNDYIIMWPIICEDQRFLTDRYDNIYSNEPARPVFIGIREISGKINRLAVPKNC